MACSVKKTAEPLKSLPELLAWRPEHVSGELKIVLDAVPSLAPQQHSNVCRPQTLLCHDMRGGYTEDSFLSGCDNNQAYRFVHWSGIDSFVYFSHHFITIPPPGWIAAAHANGVPILGTVITESDDGKQLCGELFGSLETVEQAVVQLIKIAQCHKLQGWLINIENPVQPAAIGLVLVFLQKLTAGMRAVDKQSSVVWYDSITHRGELKWQDQLNDQNSCFYEACDAIFLNYSWTLEKLAASRDYARAFACRSQRVITCTSDGNKNVTASAESDKNLEEKTVGSTDEICNYVEELTIASTTDQSKKDIGCGLEETVSAEVNVYVGVDVFGRNFYEGGGFNSDKALKVIRDQGLSAAIFAPGWTHETLGCENFSVNDARFWGSLRPYLPQHGPASWPVASTFNQGCGAVRCHQGEIVEKECWFNLLHQSLLPDILATDDGCCASLQCEDDAFEGGGCLLLTNTATAPRTVSLWSHCSLVCSAPFVEITVAFKFDVQAASTIIVCDTSTCADGTLSVTIHFTSAKEGVLEEKPYTTCNGWIKSMSRCLVPSLGDVISNISVEVPSAASVKIGLLHMRPTT